MDIHRLTPERLNDFLDFFDNRAFTDNGDWSGCFCFFPYYDPATDGDWSERTAAENRAAMCDAVKAGAASGFLAYADGLVVGWCNAASRSSFPQLRNLPGDADHTGATPCFVVDPEWRGKGVGHRLLAAACEGLREDGMQTMEAGPQKNAKTARENSRGAMSMYVQAGYRVVQEFPDGTVVVEKPLTD